MNWRNLYQKYKDVIPYAIFGVLTTLVNIVVYWIMAHICHFSVMISTVFAWVLSVLFAYLTNRKWVFNSEADSTQGILKEILSFFVCRLATGILDWVCMLVFVDLFHYPDMIIKVIANLLVIILNYVASKWFIFKH